MSKENKEVSVLDMCAHFIERSLRLPFERKRWPGKAQDAERMCWPS